MVSKKIIFSLSSISGLILSLIASQAWASLGRYIPSKKDRGQIVEQRRTVGSGTRSDCEIAFPKNSISLLVPEQKVVHRTAKSKPKLYFNSTVDSDIPIKFALVDSQTTDSLLESSIMPKSGINMIELPPRTELKKENLYLWYVAIPCRGSSQYQDTLTSSVQFEPTTSKVADQLKIAKNGSKVVDIYAENGYWYDALEASMMIKDPEDLSYIKWLLESVNLKIDEGSLTR
jgi:hypothetical protein